MIKSRRIVSFYKRNICDENEKNAFTSSKLEKLTIIQKLKKIKNNSLKFLELHIMNLKML